MVHIKKKKIFKKKCPSSLAPEVVDSEMYATLSCRDPQQDLALVTCNSNLISNLLSWLPSLPCLTSSGCSWCFLRSPLK